MDKGPLEPRFRHVKPWRNPRSKRKSAIFGASPEQRRLAENTC